MPSLSITKTYADEKILLASDIDNIIDSLESFFNDIKLGDSNISNASISSTELQDASIVEANIASNAVTSAKLDTDCITNDKISPQAITGTLIGSGIVTNNKIAENTLTRSQTPSMPLTESTEISTGTLTYGSWTTAATLVITPTLNRPVIFSLLPYNGSSNSLLPMQSYIFGSHGTPGFFYRTSYRIRLNGSSTLTQFTIGVNRGSTAMSPQYSYYPTPGIIHITTTLPAATNTITLEVMPVNQYSSEVVSLSNLKFTALEVNK